MRTQLRTRRGHPAAFTLIELLVVIAILAVLFALTSAAVMKIMDAAPRTETKVEIGQLDTAHASFCTEMNNAKFVPSRIKLSPRNNYPLKNTPGTDDANSVKWLQMLFGRRINLNPAPAGTPGMIVHDWSNQATTNLGAAAQDITLEGPECLVFFLGGIPTAPTVPDQPGTLGFSKDPQYPAFYWQTTPAPAQWVMSGQPRFGPYLPFKAKRLLRTPSNTAKNFLVYLDPYGKTPYAYYSSYGTGNDYNAFGTTNPKNDCNWLSTSTNPRNGNLPYGPLQAYSTGPAASLQYVNRDSYQIISAGKDGKFGPGGNGTWTPANGYSGSGPGADDQSNFSKGILAIGAN